MERRDSRPVIALIGPTGTGKSALAVAIAGRLAERSVRVEIVGADARQIYRELSVGTSKPSVLERAAVPHHMIDVAAPEEVFSAARYAREALICLEGIYARGGFPLVVGGSGLYIRALLEGLFEGPEADPALRSRLEEVAEREGPAALHRRLAASDPAAAARLHPNDRKRVIRALEVYEVTGRPISALQAEAAVAGFTRPRYLGLDWPMEAYAARVEERIRWMLLNGMMEEAAFLADRGLSGSPAFEGLGYEDALALHRGQIDQEEVVARICRLHRGYAKRQRTWFRKVEGVHWLEMSESGREKALDEATALILEYLSAFSAGALRGREQKG
ncbi:MAG: tRNA (adenosine(37)-N6)-dimethylallyltransferase MiaA [bacterium]|nr:tRNA (adenosine(37)-N6)-dimethylallyltransferase MiaA [bacterium]